MASRDIVVIGGSAGALSPLRQLVKMLPADFPGSVFVVIHIPPHTPSRLPEILSAAGPMKAVHPKDGDKIQPGHIYVAEADRHLLVEGDRILVKSGPKENRFRPAVDALFRSAAYVYGPRVVGVILSGALDDGTSGLWSIKRLGGLAVVQNPAEAEFVSMPNSALEHVEVDHVLPIEQIGPLLCDLAALPAPPAPAVPATELERLALEISIATEDGAFEKGIMGQGELAPFSCPECYGALVALKESDRVRFRCHTGHAYTTSVLLAGITQANEERLWQAVRGFEEAAMLLEKVAAHFEGAGKADAAKLFLRKALDVRKRARVVHDSVLEAESLSEDIQQQTTDKARNAE